MTTIDNGDGTYTHTFTTLPLDFYARYVEIGLPAPTRRQRLWRWVLRMVGR